jgi:LysR family transcriptional regulator, transcriptional activator of the cysJI operon
VTFDQLKLFKDIAQHRSVSRAADASEISQSAASQSLQDLERSLSVKLMDRSTRPIRLTPAGRLFYEFCREVLRRREEFDAELDRLKGRIEGTVRVASIYSVGLSEMSRLEEEFARRLPAAELSVDYLRPEKVYGAILADRADLGLVSYPEASREVKVIEWRQEVMVLAAAPSHPLAGLRLVELRHLQGQDFVGFDEDLPIGRELTRFLKDHGVEVNVVMRFDNIQMIKEAVALGSAISILPARIMDSEIAQKRLVAVPIQAPGLFRPLGIIHRRRKKFNRATLSFLQLLREAPQPEPVPARE